MSVGAEAFCRGLSDGKIHCWEITTGKEMPLPKELRKYGVNETATESPRVVADRWQYPRDPWWVTLFVWWAPVPGSPALPTDRVVFDLRSGDVVASWKPPVRAFTSPLVEDWPAHCAISSDGALLAESADGGLNLYRLP